MTRNQRLLAALFALAASALAGCATTTAPQGPTEWDGLVRQTGTRLGAVFLKPGAQIGAFDSVILAPVSISFASNWDPSRGTRGVGRLNAAVSAASDHVFLVVAGRVLDLSDAPLVGE